MTSPDAGQQRPNIVFVMTDDHASHAIGAYGSDINQTPNIDRVANGGMRLDNCFCTNALCAPSRATILTGTYSHVNGVTTLDTPFDNTQTTFPELLRDEGYATALFGKWHIGHGPEHDPRGFDDWMVLYGQGPYWNPTFRTADGDRQYQGYTTNIITDLSVDWLDARDQDKPFCLLVHHKAPHRPWEPDERYATLYDDRDIPLPPTWDDDYANRATAASVAHMRVADHMTKTDLKVDPPEDLTGEDLAQWKYQRYIKDYLRCVASVDDSVGRLLDYLDEHGLTENTIVVYTSDQGFFLGDHGWYDKRFMYEESLRMPFVVRYPAEIPAGSSCGDLVTNVDFAQTFLDYAGVPAVDRMQGRSARAVWRGETVPDWRDAMYYRYWLNDDAFHRVWAHYGVRTDRYKLIFYYADGLETPGSSQRTFPPEWELFDLERDPYELCSVYGDPAYAGVRAGLESTLARLQKECGDAPWTPV